MNIKDLNTDITSLERIYRYKEFLKFYFNDQHPERNADEIQQFLSNAALEAEHDKYECWKIEPENGDDDYDASLVAIGYRLETDNEYCERLSQNLTRKKIAYENWLRSKAFYESGKYNKGVAEIEETLSKLK